MGRWELRGADVADVLATPLLPSLALSRYNALKRLTSLVTLVMEVCGCLRVGRGIIVHREREV
jgi:hypothetical protein